MQRDSRNPSGRLLIFASSSLQTSHRGPPPIRVVKDVTRRTRRKFVRCNRASKVPPTTCDTRLPHDWAISEERRKFANEIGVDVDHKFAIFRDYWVARQRGLKSDWSATFRNWLRRAVRSAIAMDMDEEIVKPASESSFNESRPS
jgi:hypothetical protein